MVVRQARSTPVKAATLRSRSITSRVIVSAPQRVTIVVHPNKRRTMQRRDLLKAATTTIGGTVFLAATSAASTSSRRTPCVARQDPWIKTRDGTHLFYRDWGTGAPIVFLTGGPCHPTSGATRWSRCLKARCAALPTTDVATASRAIRDAATTTTRWRTTLPTCSKHSSCRTSPSLRIRWPVAKPCAT